jgi:NAD(P)-dependent dehydrogenase (short-subunit alcohol dehydrogenase family)
MRVVVLGGYGVFGERLVRLLLRDGHQLVVAGRSLARAETLAQALGADALAVDRGGDLTPIWDVQPDAVVDAAGPFHAYGDAPYRLAQAAIAQGVHYLDLSDDAAFCAGVSALDTEAKAAGVFALSGVSSVPAISSAAVAKLAGGARQVDTISSAILPGNRAPRGRSVIASILNQCGLPMQMPMDGVQVAERSWSRSRVFDLGLGIRRRGWMIAVPDQRLFGPAFGARSVFFRAGLELPVMNRALAAFSWLRSWWRFAVPDRFVTAMLWIAERLKPFGSDRGGMSVAVTAQYADGWQCRRWRLVAQAGEGPFIPAVAARAILRDPQAIEPGARPAVAVVGLDQIEAAMKDLAVTTEVLRKDLLSIFQTVLGESFTKLPESVQDAHLVYGPRRWAGRGKVTRGASVWARFVAAVFRFPKACDDIPVTVSMTPQNDGELWERCFDGQSFKSFLRPEGGKMTERFGPLTFTLGLHVVDGQLHYPVDAGRMGPIPLPRFLLPQSIAHEYEADGRFHFDVALLAPFSGAPMVHYQGWLVREAAESGLSDGDQQVVERP